MGDLAVSLPTLLILVPVAGGLIAMSMMTRVAAAVTVLITAAVQIGLLILGTAMLGGKSVDGVMLFQRNEWFKPWNLEYSVGLTDTGLMFAALTTVVTLCASLLAWKADRPRPAPFQGLLWLSAGALCGLFMSRDLALFYIFFELMLVPLLFLVGGWGGSERIRATMIMFVYTLAGSLLMLVGVIAVGVYGGTFDLETLAVAAGDGSLQLPTWVFVTIMAAFAVKAPLLPFHGWLPTVYRQAPIEAAALLSGVVSKAAAYGMLVIALPLFPGIWADWAAPVLIWVALAGLLYGSIAAFRQPDARGVVAYSSLAQMGLIMLGLGVFLGNGGDAGVSGALLQSVNHGLISAGLFLLIGVVELRSGTSLLDRLGGVAKGRPRLVTITLILGLCAVAVPGSSAFAGEILILLGAFRGPWEYAWIWGAIGSLGIILAAMYGLRLVAAMIFTSGDAQPENASVVRREIPTAPDDGASGSIAEKFGSDLRGLELAVMLPLVIALLVLSAWPAAIQDATSRRPVPLPSPGDRSQLLQTVRAPDGRDLGTGGAKLAPLDPADQGAQQEQGAPTADAQGEPVEVEVS